MLFDSDQKARLGGGDPKFSKIVALQGPQNHKMVALQRPKFAPKYLFINVAGAATDFKLKIIMIHHI